MKTALAAFTLLAMIGSAHADEILTPDQAKAIPTGRMLDPKVSPAAKLADKIMDAMAYQSQQRPRDPNQPWMYTILGPVPQGSTDITTLIQTGKPAAH